MLEVTTEGPVQYVKLNRPEVRNAFNDELIAALTETFHKVGPPIRAVVLSGEGKAFCAGGDLEWMRKAAAYSEDQNYEDALKLAGLFKSIAECSAVVIAKVHGLLIDRLRRGELGLRVLHARLVGEAFQIKAGNNEDHKLASILVSQMRGLEFLGSGAVVLK